jgi:isoleucyl-tRNA synthetase
MSKHKGNVVNPWDVLNKQGSDAARWYFYSNSAPWLPNRFFDEAVSESQRKFLGTLWNTYAFYVLYAEIDKFNPTEHKLEIDKLTLLDKWILSKLNTVIRTVDDYLENYKITEATRIIQEFTDELSNWYVRRSRERFWASELSDDKVSAYMTLYTVLTQFSKVCAPFIPFMTEMIYQNLVVNIDKNAPESIHLCDFPVANDKFDFAEIETEMDAARKIVILGRACRNAANIKNRQPIAKIFVQTNEKIADVYKEIILDELNVKELEVTVDASSFISYNFKPQLKTMGPKYGKIVRSIFEEVNKMNGADIMKKLNAGELIKLVVEGTDVEFGIDDVLVETLQKDGFVSDSDTNYTVVLDTNLTDALIEEGFVREILSKIQTMRKDNGYEVQDNIKVYYSGSDKIDAVITDNKAEIAAQSLAISIENAYNDGKEWNINGEKVKILIEKV